MGKEQSEVPVHLPESGSDSRAPQTLPGVTEELVLGSLGHMETKDVRFSVLDTSDTAGCQGRAENGAGGWGLGEESPRLALAAWLGLAGRRCHWSTERPLGGRLDPQLIRRRPAPLLQHGGC